MKERVRLLTVENRNALTVLEHALLGFNKKHNLISNRAEEYVYEHHIRHCMAYGCLEFKAGSRVVDWGSGGGLPALPLALIDSNLQIIAVDKVGKKMMAVDLIARKMGLKNLTTYHGLAESYHEAADISVSRATAPLATLWMWHSQVSSTENMGSHSLTVSDQPEGSAAVLCSSGLLCLKGGDISADIEVLIDRYPTISVSGYKLKDLFPESYYSEKILIHVHESGKVKHVD